MSAQAPTQPAPAAKAPETLAQFGRLVAKGMVKRLPLKLALAAGAALLAWIIHTYLLVVPNEGFVAGTNRLLDQVLALRGQIFSSTLVWVLFAMLLTTVVTRVIRMGPAGTVRHLIETPAWTADAARKTGLLSVSLLFAGAGLAMLVGTILNQRLLNLLLSWLFLGIFIARHTSMALLILRLSWSDLQRLARRDTRLPFNIQWAALATLGISFGFFGAALQPFHPFCGCAGVVVLLLGAAAVPVFRRLQPGTGKLTAALLAVGLLALLATPVLADDGGWSESGGTLGDWLGSEGAPEAVARGFLPAAGVAVGVLAGLVASSAGAAVSGLGLTAGGGQSLPGVDGFDGLDKMQEADPADASQPDLHVRHQPAAGDVRLREAGTGPPEQPPPATSSDQLAKMDEAAGEPGAVQPPHERHIPADDHTVISGQKPLESPADGDDAPGLGKMDDSKGLEEPLSAKSAADQQPDSVDQQIAKREEGPDVAGRPTEDRPAVREPDLTERHTPWADPAKERGAEVAGDPTGGGRDLHGMDREPGPPSGQPETGEGGAADAAREADGLAQDQPGVAGDVVHERHTPDHAAGDELARERHQPDAAETGDLAHERHRPDQLETADMVHQRHDPGRPGGEELARQRQQPDELGDVGSRQRHAPDSPDVPDGDLAQRHQAEPPVDAEDATAVVAAAAGVAAGIGAVVGATAGEVAPGWRLLVIHGEDRGQAYDIGERLRIGRDSKWADLVRGELKVSRQHAVIEWQEGAYRITDLQSSNGTFINRERISQPAGLAVGDRIKIGDTFYEVRD